MRAAFALLVVALTGCQSPLGVQEPGPTVQGPTDLGQSLSIDVQNAGRDDLHLRITLAGQPEVRFLMTAGARGGEVVTPHVAKAYEGSIPPGTEVVVREGDREARLTVDDRGMPAYLLIEPNYSDGSLGIARFDEQPGYD